MIGLDFGTTFSGIACAARSNEKTIIFEENWDAQADLVGSAYCKTITASLYRGNKLEAWGWPAILKYNKAIEGGKIAMIKSGSTSTSADVNVGDLVLLERFKLLLAPPGSKSCKTPIALPAGLTAEKVVTDYLEQIGAAGLALLRRNFGDFIQLEHVQWCITGKQRDNFVRVFCHVLRNNHGLADTCPTNALKTTGRLVGNLQRCRLSQHLSGHNLQGHWHHISKVLIIQFQNVRNMFCLSGEAGMCFRVLEIGTYCNQYSRIFPAL